MAFSVALQAFILAGLLAVTMAGVSTTSRYRFCGEVLSHAVSMVCRSFNSPAWDEGSLPARNRVRRDIGIADECCNEGCGWDVLRLYCADDEPGFPSADIAAAGAVSEERHLIADRSVEAAAAAAGEPPAPASFRGLFGRSEVGTEGRGPGRARRGRGRRCWCRRKRRTGRKRGVHVTGNMMGIRGVARSAPVVGTVSPLLTWGRTLHTDLPQHDRLVYVP